MMKRRKSTSMPGARVPLRAGLALASGLLVLASPPADGQTSALSQTPLFVSQSQPPLNMLVMGRDHKLYYEAYNDASDLDGDGVIDVGYKPDQIDYYGYFNNSACYTYADGMFKIAAAAVGDKKKKCAGNTHWSGDYLNYVGTSRMDAIRRVLYGGMRTQDTNSTTVLQAAYIPRDAHAWGKAYDPARDGSVYDIEDYTPLQQPRPGTRHLLAVTTLSESADTIPQLRVLNDSLFQIWDWISQEGPAGQGNCAGSGSCTVDRETQEYRMLTAASFRNLSIATYRHSGATPSNLGGMNQFFNAWANPSTLCGTGSLSVIDTEGSSNNPFAGSNRCSHDNYLTLIKGQVYIPEPGNYRFALDGDDAVDATIGGTTWGWYGTHAANRAQGALDSHAQNIYFSSAGWKDLLFRHVDGSGGDGWGLALKMVRPASAIASYGLRVEACASRSAALREASCKAYPNSGGQPLYKPTGLLHDFGESGKMYFGLLTGSYEKNIAGGVVRRNVGSFMDEINAQTGQFRAGVDGVVANIDRQRLIGYNGRRYAACGWVISGALSTLADPSVCAMWGNPIGEMMFETMRYFSGASGALGTYDYASGSGTKDAQLGLSKPAWRSPYKDAASGGGGYQRCSRPVMTVISDINPSYDSKLPGSRYANINANASALSGFNAATETRAIGQAEGINGKSFFIGQSTSGNANQAPSAKTISDLSWARGLSPQEPSKEGTYYGAGVARFGANNAVFGQNPLMTYSVAIASPLPEIRFPVGRAGTGGNQYVTIVPFAKSVTGGSGIDNTVFTPTNQIVDYYVDRIANTGTADADASVNEGRPYAEFRINYEDMEQGADHDMDAIARYVVRLQADGKVKIDIFSEYAAGSYGQHMGYVVSGTTKDGMYLEVRDKDTDSVYYAYNTPPGRDPGYCVNASGERRNECAQLGLSASRTFAPSSSATSGSFLKNPLWYAAKYGIPERNTSAIAGDPDNYFLVTNASTLKDQLTRAFNSIVQDTSSVTAVSVDMPTANLANGADLYRTSFEAESWSGDVLRESLQAGSTTLQWSAAQKLSEQSPDERKIYYAGKSAAGAVLRPFTFSGISRQTADAGWLAALDKNPATGVADGLARQRLAFLRGQADDDLRQRKLLANGRPNVLGDIVNASLMRVKGPLYQTAAADKLEGSGSDYAAFVRAQAGKPEMLYVGANDGMLHAFNAATGAETFAFIPSAVKDSLGLLTTPSYGAKGGLPHRYFVDGNSFVSDVYFGSAWHRVLIGSLGAGGRQIFALDITDPAAPALLWEFGAEQHASMGYSVPRPSIARLNDAGTTKGKWVVLLPNGYEGDNSRAGDASLFVLDVANGSVLKRFDLDGAMTAQELTASLPLGNGLSRLAAIDNNTDGKVDMVYAGDLAGNLWRLDLSSGSSAGWSAKRFFTARDGTGKRQSITAAPYVVRHPTGKGDLVIFGTGRFMADADKLNLDTQTLYGIWDRHSSPGTTAPATLPSASKNRSHLQAQAFTELADYPGKFWLSANTVAWYTGTGTTDADVSRWGWYVNLPRRGERLIYDPSLYGRGLVFTSIRTSQDICESGMNSALYDIDPNTGGQLKFVAFDVKQDGFFNASDRLGGQQISGYEVGSGKQTVSGGIIFNPNGQKAVAQEDSGGGINHGVDVGRQSWRRQPAN